MVTISRREDIKTALNRRPSQINTVTGENKSPLLLTLLLILLPGLLFAQESVSTDLDEWFDEEEAGKNYLANRLELELIFASASSAGIPVQILLEKLNEGASKGIPGDKLVNVLRETFKHLESARSILAQLTLIPSDKESCVQILKTLSLYIRGGLPPLLLQEMLAAAAKKDRELPDMLELAETILKIRQASRLEDNQLLKLAHTLLDSRLQPASYSALASLFREGKIRHMKDTTLLELFTSVLENSGGLIQLNDELNRRTGYK